MKQALRFQDEKSDKFWRVETADCELMTNWGKTGTSGRYEIKGFDSPEECEKQAEKQAAFKQKKGYQIVPDLTEDGHCYFDTDEYGPHPLTSHPVFRAYFLDDIYYDCMDEEAPFGSDEGSDTLHELFETFQKRPNMDFADFPRRIIEDSWALTYFPPDPAQTDETLLAQAAEKFNGLPGEQEILQSDQIILATAFGQIKITGKLHPALQELAFQSLNRMERMNRLLWNWDSQDPPPYVAIMGRDLRRFVTEVGAV